MAYRKKYTPRRYVKRRARTYRAARSSYRRRAPVRRARKTGRSKCVCPAEMTPGTKFVLAQLDPFDASALGAKIPDSNTMPSIANSDCDIVNVGMSGTATDLVVRAFRPAYTWGSVNATTGTPPAWPAAFAGGNDRSKRTAYLAAMELTRPVAHAIRISSPLAPTSASGFVHLGLATESTFGETTWQYPTSLAQMSGLQFYKRVTLASLTQSPLTVINKWLDDTAFRYNSPASTYVETSSHSTFQTDLAWATIIVMVEGAPVSTTCLSIEHLLLSEGIPKKDGVIIGSQAAPNSPQIISAVSSLSTAQEPFHTEAEQQSYIQRGVSAVAQGAAAHGENIFQQVAVPLLQRVGAYGANAAAAMAYNALAGVGGIAGVNNNANRLALN